MSRLIVVSALLLVTLLEAHAQFPWDDDNGNAVNPSIPDDNGFAPFRPPQPRPRPRPTTTQPPPPATGLTLFRAPEDCSCPFTRQFNPVCGTDGNTYGNIGVLNCFIQCGTSQATVRYQGACRRSG